MMITGKLKHFKNGLWQILAIINGCYIWLFPDTSRTRMVHYKMYFSNVFHNKEYMLEKCIEFLQIQKKYVQKLKPMQKIQLNLWVNLLSVETEFNKNLSNFGRSIGYLTASTQYFVHQTWFPEKKKKKKSCVLLLTEER